MQAVSRGIDTSITHSPMPGSDMMRGRTRDRSHPRAALAGERLDKVESSTFRGRSRQRASSPPGPASRNPSRSMLSPTRQILLHNRLRDARREHCPSRPARDSSPSQTAALQQRRRRTRSRSRGPRRLEADMQQKTVETHSSLRHQVRVDSEPTNSTTSSPNMRG
ncbi:uncharacterized protein F5Z01DRAFT_642603 [Emericellopsis atlantica]|uniref:Uncharacterized protein n=1 Tax=Emericellopsis atlantica TaxID=2614577 RepID=A0A9P7ZX56_9HYPO|nr:uncharacterized protein F5Z01DRAFT_642603 [Emericellopsis atlantica]KAG9259207.1 hypothetical protein F5Z01DRAFT_642603 [Emericellopsis atlantica]